MKRIKNKFIYMLALPLVIVLGIVSINIINNVNGLSLDSEFVYDLSEKNYRKVYLLDDSNTLVPLTIEVNKKEYLVDEIYTVVSNLRDLKVKGFNNILESDIKINKIEINEGILNIDFSKEFLDYDKNIEEKIIESLTWSVMEFDEIKGLTISVEGEILKSMPLNGYSLPKVLDKSIGINKYSEMISRCNNCNDIVVVYSKIIDDKEYYIPVTRLVENDKYDFISAYDKEVSVLSGLNKVLEIDRLNNIKVEEDNMNIHLDESYLIEDNIVNSSVYELLSVMLYYNDFDYKVNFFVNDESVEVNGYSNMEELKVSSIRINEIKI